MPCSCWAITHQERQGLRNSVRKSFISGTSFSKYIRIFFTAQAAGRLSPGSPVNGPVNPGRGEKSRQLRTASTAYGS